MRGRVKKSSGTGRALLNTAPGVSGLQVYVTRLAWTMISADTYIIEWRTPRGTTQTPARSPWASALQARDSRAAASARAAGGSH